MLSLGVLDQTPIFRSRTPGETLQESIALAREAERRRPELITTTLDLELGEYLRRTVFNFEKHRRTEHYGLITSRTGAKTEV